MKQKIIFPDVDRFLEEDVKFHKSINDILDMDIPPIDFIHQFPVFTGHVNIARYLFFYDLYKKCYELPGAIADVGTWKGSSFLFLSKLVKIFENLTYTQVHGFDWFQGMETSDNDDINQKGKYRADYATLKKLIEIQNLEQIAILHKMDLTKELDSFFQTNRYLRFKLVFIDCGITEVLEESLKYFFPRIVRNGILIMDHFNSSSSPNESSIIEKYIETNVVRQMTYTRQPTGYIIKEF